MASEPRGLIDAVAEHGPAWRAGIRTGDTLVALNGLPARDVIDVMWVGQDGWFEATLERDGRRFDVEVELDEGEDPGLRFHTELFDGLRRCPNRCVFCFVDQQPSGLRPSLYVKDEDYRASFLHGNYVTLTNLRPDDLARIVEMHLSPLYVSVHATDETARRRLLGRKRLPPILPLLDDLGEEGIRFWTQIVLVPGWNDDAILARTLADLTSRYPVVQGVAVVPVGLTGHRCGLPPLQPVSAAGARRCLDCVDGIRDAAVVTSGKALVYGADELFLRARRPIPEAAYYEGYPLLENGVGMLRRFLDGVHRALRRRRRRAAPTGPVTAVVTGTAAGPFFRRHVLPAIEPYGPPPMRLVVARHRLLQGPVGVAGLLAGKDVGAALARGPRPDRVLLCDYALVDGRGPFLDDMTLDDVAERVGCPVVAVPDDPAALVRTLFAAR